MSLDDDEETPRQGRDSAPRTGRLRPHQSRSHFRPSLVDCDGGSGDFARYEVSGGPMTFSSCEDHCASLGGTVACVTSDADETAFDALRAEAACGEVWVGFNDADGDGAWGWPAGCSSAREYGE